MECPYPDRWMSLDGFSRDLLATLAVCGPASGSELWDATGSREGRKRNPPMYVRLGELVDAGLVEKEEWGRDDRTHEYRATSVGKELADRSKEGLEW